VLSNTLFDTTRANIEYSGSEGIDLLCAEGKQMNVEAPFKGNMDTEALRNFIGEKGAATVAMVIVTITNNSAGGSRLAWPTRKKLKVFAMRIKYLFILMPAALQLGFTSLS
jgi:tryptophanase